MRELVGRIGRFAADRISLRFSVWRDGPWALPVVLAVLAASAGYVGWRDWQGHRPEDAPGRSAFLCRQPTGAGTALGRLLPEGGAQDTEDWTAGTATGSCVVRVDGRTVVAVDAVRREGQLTLASEGAKRPDAHPFGAGGLSASWPGGAAVALNCVEQPTGYLEVEAHTGEAARGAAADLEEFTRGLLPSMAKELCR
ncbi:hypothetical protein [Kitasatospora sp. NPDC101183]|uniref:hypothetical protein n=1 Tax=Kitasatospora sp. NPDC101183 TaxID=3364100 RepID=UPI0037FB9274